MEFPYDVETAYGTISPDSLGELTEILFKAGVASVEVSKALGELCFVFGDTIQEMKNWNKRKIRRYKRRERELKIKLKRERKND